MVTSREPAYATQSIVSTGSPNPLPKYTKSTHASQSRAVLSSPKGEVRKAYLEVQSWVSFRCAIMLEGYAQVARRGLRECHIVRRRKGITQYAIEQNRGPAADVARAA